jgi:hypothetical protein
MPTLLNGGSVPLDDLGQEPNGSRVEAVVSGNGQAFIQSKLRFMAVPSNVDMNGFSPATLVAVEEKPIASFTDDDGHSGSGV